MKGGCVPVWNAIMIGDVAGLEVKQAQMNNDNCTLPAIVCVDFLNCILFVHFFFSY